MQGARVSFAEEKWRTIATRTRATAESPVPSPEHIHDPIRVHRRREFPHRGQKTLRETISLHLRMRDGIEEFRA